MRTPLVALLAPAALATLTALPGAAQGTPPAPPVPPDLPTLYAPPALNAQRSAARGAASASRTSRASRVRPSLPEEPAARRLAVGFSRSPLLREALRGRLIAAGRYQLDAAPQLPDSPGALLVGGQVAALREADGFYECRARFFVARQPEGAALVVDHVAASVPLAPLSDGDSALREGRAVCLSELAEQIAGRVASLYVAR